MIDLGDKAASCGNSRVLQMLGIFPDVEDVEPVIGQLGPQVAAGTISLAGK